jgi:hypothetical protein
MKTLNLPITYPPIASFPCHAFYLSIMGNHDVCSPWIYSHYVHYAMYFGNDFILPDYIVPHPEYHYNPWFYSHSQRLTRNTVFKLAPARPEFIRFLKEALSDGYYVYIHIDEYYIPGTVSYQTKRFPHAMLLYGFDDEAGCFNTAGFFKQGAANKYSFSQTTYDQLHQAFVNCETDYEYLNFMHLYKLNPQGHNGHVPGFETETLIRSIDDFLQSARPSSTLLDIPPFAPVTHVAYGLNTYDRLAEALDNKLFENRKYYLIWEHKQFMLKRIQYLSEQGGLGDMEAIYQQFKQIGTDAEVCLKLLLKYAMSEDARLLHRVQLKLEQMRSSEQTALKHLKDHLFLRPC